MEDARRRVLVADAEPDVRLLCRSTLGFAGYDVVEAGDGEEALRRAREHRPDVVLLDVMLSGPDGWQVLAALEAAPDLCAIPVVMLTKAAEGDPARAWSQGAADWLAKPFSPLTLSQVLQDVLASAPEEHERRRRMILETPELLQNE